MNNFFLYSLSKLLSLYLAIGIALGFGGLLGMPEAARELYSLFAIAIYLTGDV